MHFELDVVKETENNTWPLRNSLSLPNKERRQTEQERVYESKETNVKIWKTHRSPPNKRISLYC